MLPGRYLNFEVARRPSTSRTGPDRAPTGCSRHAPGPRLMKKCIARHPAGALPLNGGTLLMLGFTFCEVRIVYICSGTLLLMDLCTRVHSLNEKKIKNGPTKEDLEGTEAAGYCDSPNFEPVGSDVVFGEDDAP